jgi:serine/threonine protein kinase/ABC-type amino acid transport substrate-binding protein
VEWFVLLGGATVSPTPPTDRASFARARATLRAAVAVMCALIGLVGSSDRAGADEPATGPGGRRIRVGGDAFWAPGTYLDDDGAPRGFGVDLVKALLDHTGVTIVEIQLGVWADQLEALDKGELDVVIGGLRTREREPLYDFTAPYRNVHVAVFGRGKAASALHSVAELKGEAVVVPRGTVGASFLVQVGAIPVEVDSEPEALDVLASSAYEYAVVSLLNGLIHARQNRLEVAPVLPSIMRGGLRFLVAKGDPLAEQLNEALALVKASGEYDAIYERWYSAADREATVITVRAGRDVQPRWRAVMLGVLAALALLLTAALVALWWRRRQAKRAASALRDQPAGEVVGSYRLIERIGADGMGEVWRAEHVLLNRPAAVKRIRPAAVRREGVSLEDVQRRFEREARATATLRSPNTVELYDYGRTADGNFYYVMELLQGMDLESLVSRFGPVPPERCLFLLAQACASLAEAHEQGMLHRDVKPANIFACKLGTAFDVVKVLDFGLVSWGAAEPQQEVTRTCERGLVGTPAFLAPELVLGEAADQRSDIYSLGCVGYWLLTGRLLFSESTRVGMSVAHATRSPVPPSWRAPRTIPLDVERVIMACLEKSRSSRPPSARALARALMACECYGEWTPQRRAAWWREHPTAAASHHMPQCPSDLIATAPGRSTPAPATARRDVPGM